MTAAVDLVAVRRAREALRAVAAARPELTATATRNRAEAWMHNQEHNQMSRKLNDEQPSTADQIGVRLPPDLLARLDAEAGRLSALTATPFTRSMVVRSVLSRALPPLDSASSSTPTPPAAVTDAAPQEAAQSPRRGSTPRSTGRARKAAAEPPTPARVADDGNDQEEADARHAARGAAHTELTRIETLRADLAAARVQTGLSFKKIGAAVGCCDGSVIRFLDGRIQGWPTWGDKARAWLDALPPAASSPDLQRPLFTAGSPNDDAS